MWWIILVQIISTLVIIFAITIVKKYPEHLFNTKLEEFRHQLQEELEKFKVSESNLHPKKIEMFTDFTNMILKIINLNKITDSKKYNREMVKLGEEMTQLGFGFFFFCSDDTIKKYIEYRKYITMDPNILGPNEQAKMVMILAELMVLMRKDLGYSNTAATVDDFLYIFLRDWKDTKEEFIAKAEKAIIP